MTAERILIVEDEVEFADLVRLWLDRHGWQTLMAHDGHEALRLFDGERPDLVLLDIGLPGLDGWQLIDRIRERSEVPVLVVSALGAETDKVRGLGAGADDYMDKPVSFPELIARVQAALRRSRRGAASSPDPGIVMRGPVRIYPQSHRVLVEGIEIHLTPTEFRLLRHLAERPGELVRHRELLQAVWGPAYGDDTQLLRVTMRNLRAKLAAAAPERRFIATEYGLGYRFAES
ncbi:MAG: response regulator transcription factor [Chloroflexi bacterium]|nr:response regulator transcription factor [Chloroflexota bacterium]